VAERLGVPFLDRQIPEAVARETGLSKDAVKEVDEGPRSRMERVAATLGRASTPAGATWPADQLDLQERRLRGYIEAFLAQSASDGGVALGRGGMVVLADVPWALHVHLGGPPAARIRQAMQLEGIDEERATARCGKEDRARIEYVRRAYGVDGEDPALYHLMLDSTALDLATCVELIVVAGKARSEQSERPRSEAERAGAA
jgi:hypothetical protein